MHHLQRRCCDIIILLALLGAFIYVAGPGTVTAAETPRWPNIVFTMADGLGYGSLGCYGSKVISTPNIVI